ncbi:MAG: hypothetical protein OXI51_08500 [Chloroflexota bacterium]|nr:hypothetical protein [Chloroflexota bacterium]
MEEFTLAAVYGAGLGLVAGGTLSVMGPFSRGDERAAESSLLLLALCLLAVGGGVLVLDSWTVTWVVLATTVAGGIAFWLWGRGGVDMDVSTLNQPLSLTELRRPKTQEDCWLVVTGTPASGKTTLTERMVAAALDLDRLRWAGPPRIGEDGGVRVTELPLLASGSVRTLRFWERGWDGPWPPGVAPRDLDGAVMVIDPTCVKDTAGTFPEAMKAGPSATDVNTQAITLDASLAKAGRTVAAWHVITKADLVRFSIDASVVKLVKAGTGWYQQMRGFDITGRRELADYLGIDTTERAALRQGQGSPFLTYAGRGPSGSGSFGAGNLLRTIIDTLIPEASHNRGDYRAP